MARAKKDSAAPVIHSPKLSRGDLCVEAKRRAVEQGGGHGLFRLVHVDRVAIRRLDERSERTATFAFETGKEGGLAPELFLRPTVERMIVALAHSIRTPRNIRTQLVAIFAGSACFEARNATGFAACMSRSTYFGIWSGPLIGTVNSSRTIVSKPTFDRRRSASHASKPG